MLLQQPAELGILVKVLFLAVGDADGFMGRCYPELLLPDPVMKVVTLPPFPELG